MCSARFAPGEVVRLALDFYKRNFIEGLFLSSGIIRGAGYTMELLIEVARMCSMAITGCGACVDRD
jgi:predicted DNA-binding helix-hairpin-helix protein